VRGWQAETERRIQGMRRKRDARDFKHTFRSGCPDTIILRGDRRGLFIIRSERLHAKGMEKNLEIIEGFAMMPNSLWSGKTRI
jgi:hypothetical protein